VVPPDPVVSAILGVFALFAVLGLRDATKDYVQVEASGFQLKDNLEQVKLLFEYTKFHITAYGTTATLLIGICASSIASSVRLDAEYLIAAVACILAAGVAAGIVAASMPECTSKADFWSWQTGPYNLSLLTIRSWTYVEHTSFWLAVFFVILSFCAGDGAPPARMRFSFSLS
jgi:hypothetical protein